MPPQSAPPCPHELRPGTAVCLRCQHAERAAARSRQRRLIARGAVVVVALGAVAAVGIAGASALRGRGAASAAGGDVRSSARSPSSAPSSEAAAAGSTPSVAALVSASDSGLGPLTSTAALPVSAGAAGRAPVAPVVREGRTELRDTIFAVRAGDTVRVYFDRAMTRTRRPDKFEWIVRSTLPQVFGPVGDSALAAMPAGGVARAGDLVAELPVRGLRLSLAGGQVITIWPETRPGRDGPLIASYRALATPF